MEELVINAHVARNDFALADVLTSTPRSSSVCIVTGMDRYAETYQGSLRCLTSASGDLGLVVSTTRSYPALREFLTDKGLDMGRIFVIDAVPGTKTTEYANCMRIPLPTHLSGLSDEIISLAVSAKAKFVLADSLERFLVYAEPKEVGSFFQTLLNGLKAKNIALLGLCLESIYTSDDLDGIFELFDKKVELR